MPITELLSLTLPIFLLIGLGLFAVRAGISSTQQIDGLAKFVLDFALPALILNALSRQDLSQTFDWRYIVAYGGGSLVAFSATFFILRLGLERTRTAAAIGALGGATSNTGFIGFPVASLAFGATALTAMPLNMLVENILIIPLALALAESGVQDGGSLLRSIMVTAKRLSRMPIIMAIVLGALLSLLHISLPGALSTAIGMLAKASAACALFVVGGTIATLRAGGTAGDITWIVAAKLVLHPLAVAAFFVAVGGTDPSLMKAGIVMASVSMITVYPIFGSRFGMGGVCATGLVAATGIGFFTITAVLGIVLG